MVEVKFPWPPSVNRMWRNIKGRTLLSKAGREYRTACLADVLMQRVKRDRLKGGLKVEILAFPPDKRRRDLDNMLKGILDALTYCGIIEDDSEIDKIEIQRGTVNCGHVLIQVEHWRAPF